MPDILEKLNEKQREAVLETEGYVRVIAGAGSGKTKLLVSRYAYLVQDYGIDSANILCVTFTNKAAGEMKKRIRALIGDEYDTTLICTYHGFCNRLLRENPEKLFLNKQFQIIDAYQQKAILSEIYQKFELKLDYASFESMLHKIGAVKSKGDYVSRICNPEPCQILPAVVTQDDKIIEEFLQVQKATYALDFHDLIAFAIYVLENNAEVREKWQDRLNYIMVDEFQDSSSLEMRLIEILSGKYRNLMIVGDPDQNIYEWRGSDVKLLVDFDKEHVPTETIILNQNYRSTPQILRCANTLIEKNQLRLKKDLFTQNESGAPVIHIHSKNDYEEMDQVIANIKRLCVQEKFKYSDIAILYRSGFLSRVAEKKLVERNIPYEIFGGVKFYQRMEILDILAYLKLIVFDDDTSFRRIINTPRRRFGRAKMNLLDELRDSGPKAVDQLDLFHMEEEEPNQRGKQSLYETLKANLGLKDFMSSDAAVFVEFVEAIRSNVGKMRISEIVNRVSKDSGYEAYIRELGDEERLDNLAEFKRICNEFEREFGENLTLEEFLQQIALQSGEDTEEGKDTVKLMTIHSSKGLEFPVVFILGFTEGVFPSSKTIEDRKNLGLEEERRLCYVAITRAEKYLFLMDSEGTSQNGMKKLVSRFLDEIGIDNYNRIGVISDELLRESRGYAAKLNREISASDMLSAGRNIGDTVTHHIFGEGTIEAIDEKRGNYTVKFANMPQPRNISKAYFETEHEDTRKKYVIPKVNLPGTVVKTEEDTSVSDLKLSIGETEFDKNEDTIVMPAQTVDNSGEPTAPEKTTETAEQIEVAKPPVIKAQDDDLEVDDVGTDEPNTDFEDTGVGLSESGLSDEQKRKLQELKDNSPNLWKRDDVPHSGWECVGVEDLGAPVGICEMCGYQIIRYAHHMEHKDYPRPLVCGCVCAGKMEGNVEEAKRREAEFKNKQARRISFFNRKWKRSQKGNEYIKIDDHVIVLYYFAKGSGGWKYSIDKDFCKSSFTSKERAMAAAFEELEKVRNL